MTRDPIAVAPETPLKDAIRLMAERHVSGLPVLKDGKLVGELSEDDLMWRESGVTPPPFIQVLDSFIYLQNPGEYEHELHKALGETVGEVMGEHHHTIRAAQPLPEAARQLHDRKVQRLFVLDESGALVGVLTRGDVVRSLATEA